MMRNLWMALALLFCFQVSIHGDEYNVPLNTAEIPRLQPTITLDGKLDEDVWQKAEQLSMRENMEGKSVEEKTTLYLFYDDEALYLGFYCEDRDIQATYTEHDAHLWDEEVLEFFVYPGSEITSPVEYIELQWNPLGTTFDATIKNFLKDDGSCRNYKGDHDWTARGMEHAVTVDGTVQDSSDRDRSWQGEVRIPFSALEVDSPTKGDVWRANIYRYSRNEGAELINMAWNPTLSHYHEPTAFGKFIFQ
jgi:hypothetical protein